MADGASPFETIVTKSDPCALFGYVRVSFESTSLSDLFELATAAEGLTKRRNDDLREAFRNETPEARAWLESTLKKLDSDHDAFITSLREQGNLDEWASALVAELHRRRDLAGHADVFREPIDRACRAVGYLLDYRPG
jgi:hypothetical protein